MEYEIFCGFEPGTTPIASRILEHLFHSTISSIKSLKQPEISFRNFSFRLIKKESSYTEIAIKTNVPLVNHQRREPCRWAGHR